LVKGERQIVREAPLGIGAVAQQAAAASRSRRCGSGAGLRCGATSATSANFADLHRRKRVALSPAGRAAELRDGVRAKPNFAGPTT